MGRKVCDYGVVSIDLVTSSGVLNVVVKIQLRETACI